MSSDDTKPLEDLLKKIGEENEGADPISIEAVLKASGQRSFGPVLLVPGLIALSPLSGIPGVPTMVGLMVLLVSSQLLIGRSEFWMPQFVLRRSVSQSRFQQAMKGLGKVARFIDRLLKPRITWLTKGVAMYVIAGLCLLLSLAAPLLELLPFAITAVGGAITAFGLALISNDGVLALLAFVFCIATAVVAVMAAG